MVAGSTAACVNGDHVAEWLTILEDSLDADPFDDRMWQAFVTCCETIGQHTRAADARWRRERALEQMPSARWRAVPLEPKITTGARLIGRDRELDELAALLSVSRLVTVVGPPGSGKTRLALEVAAASELPVRIVTLADHSSLAQALCSGLGIPAIPGAPSIDSLARYTAPDQSLVVLDNCEHMVEEVADYVRAAGVYSPGLRLLATSRVPLRVPEERVYLLAGLSTVPEEGDKLSSAAQLLSARLGLPDATEIQLNDIASRLDGIPLALEVTAAAMGRLSTGQILTRVSNPVTLTQARIRGVPERHSSLGHALGSSFDLLSEPARLVFRRVAWFSGDFREEDATGVVPELDRAAIEGALDDLVTSSLLWSTADGYRTLWVIAAYARAIALEVADEGRCHHAAHISRVVTALSSAVFGANALAAHERLEALAVDIDEALDYAAANDAGLAVRLAADLAWHWHACGKWPDRLRIAELVVDAASSEPSEMTLAARAALMMLQFDLRDVDAALVTAKRMAEESARINFFRGTILAEAMIAAIHSTTGDRSTGLAAAARAQDAAEELNEPWLRCVAWFAEASIHMNTDTHSRAIELCRSIVGTADPEPLLWSAAAYVLAGAARGEGMTDLAEGLIDRAVTQLDHLGEPLFRPLAHLEQAMVYRALKRPLAAARILLAILDEALRLGDWMASVPCIEGLALIASDLDQHRTAATLHASAGSKRRNASWDFNPWELPEAITLADKLAEILPTAALRNAIQRAESLNDQELLDLAKSVIKP